MIAVGVVAILATGTTIDESQQYVEHGSVMRNRRIGIMLGMFYLQYGSWTGVQPVVEQVA